MKYLILSGNPKKDGLCHSLIEEAKRGAADGGAEIEVITLEKLERCHVCGNGWGTCREKHTCAFGKDGFDEVQAKARAADAFCFITPVYWAETAESLKCFFDRFRRCENMMNSNGALSGKQVLLIASPGGSGNGML
ncbi:flavodoxin family protein, partial [Treponema endosymbiont of Eucomonympha sp.]|uniref:flavodoxin family protein n=1 Tax=Treponema endosymbiont of Eucomonympha sp. TaxID=1580831 RepID=UPI000781D7AC